MEISNIFANYQLGSFSEKELKQIDFCFNEYIYLSNIYDWVYGYEWYARQKWFANIDENITLYNHFSNIDSKAYPPLDLALIYGRLFPYLRNDLFAFKNLNVQVDWMNRIVTTTPIIYRSRYIYIKLDIQLRMRETEDIGDCKVFTNLTCI